MIATLADVIATLEDTGRAQREKLAALREHAAAIRALHDDDHERALREIRRRLRAPKLAGEVERLLDLLLDRTPNPRPPGAAPPDDDGPEALAAELEAAIAADPDAPGPYAVYADVLQHRGHPLGELIAIGQELRRQPHSAALLAAHRSHLEQHGNRLLGPLAEQGEVLEDVDWYMGFIRACRISTRWRELDLGLVVRWLLDRPGPARFLQRLVVGIGPRVAGMGPHVDDQAYARACAALARRPRPTLRSLALGDYQSEAYEPAPADASAVWAVAPGLRELIVRHAQIAVAPMRLPVLERLWLRTTAEGLPAFAATAELPALEHLAVQLDVPGTYWEPGELDAGEVAAALRALRLPRLRALAISAPRYGDALCRALAEAPLLLAQLEELDLGDTVVGDAGAAVLRTHRTSFRHLRLLARADHLGPAGRADLEASVAELALSDDRPEPEPEPY